MLHLDVAWTSPATSGSEQVYFRLGPLLHTEHLRGQEEDDQLLRNLRDVTKQRVQASRAPGGSPRRSCGLGTTPMCH